MLYTLEDQEECVFTIIKTAYCNGSVKLGAENS